MKASHYFVILNAITAHYVWAFAFFWPTEKECTALADSIVFLRIFGFGQEYLGMFVVASAAVVSLLVFEKRRILSLALVLPQQMVLIASFWGAVVAIGDGRFPDGYAPGPNEHVFILKDQTFSMTAAFFHSWVIVDAFAGKFLCQLKHLLLLELERRRS